MTKTNSKIIEDDMVNISRDNSPSNIRETNSQSDQYNDNFSQVHTSNNLNQVQIRASKPYSFIPKNGAPSVQGKKIKHLADKIYQSSQYQRQLYLSVKTFDCRENNSQIKSIKHQQNKIYKVQKRQIHILKQNLKAYSQLSNKRSNDFIPCLFLKFAKGSSKIFLYFHANAEDLGRAYKFLSYVNLYLKMHVISVEYPGYGVYRNENPSADKIIQDADTVYNFIVNKLNWSQENIVVCGRSIGSGPACYLASLYKPSCLVLISPHTSIRGIVKDQLLGKFTQYMVQERFRNYDVIKQVTCPTFILHGIMDNLVSYQHSQILCDSCGGPSFLLLPEQMDHNNLDVIGDFIAPLSEFLENFNIQTNNSPENIIGQSNRKHEHMEVENSIDIESQLEDPQLLSDEEYQVPTEYQAKETQKSNNRCHPAIKSSTNFSKTKAKVFMYQGPFLIINDQYFENPISLIQLAKNELKKSLQQKQKLFQDKKDSLFSLIFPKNDQLKDESIESMDL